MHFLISTRKKLGETSGSLCVSVTSHVVLDCVELIRRQNYTKQEVTSEFRFKNLREK